MKIGPIQVDADFDAQGKIRPHSFNPKGHTVLVESIGRQWRAKDGHHILVMDANYKRYHLIFQPDSGEWFMLEIDQHLSTSRA